MEHDQASEAIQTSESATGTGAENDRERAKSLLLAQMSQPAQPPSELSDESGADTNEIHTIAGSGSNSEPEQPSGESDWEGTASEEVSGEEPKKPKLFRGRWDHLSEQDRRVVELTTKRGLTLSEAYRAVFGVEHAPANALADHSRAPGDLAGDMISTLDAGIEEQERRIVELKKRKAQAKGDLNLYDEASEAYVEARYELRALQEKRSQALQESERKAADARQKTETLAKATLAEEFPDALTPGTELHDACVEEQNYLRDSNSPLIRDPQFEYKVARRMARVLGLRRSAGSEGPASAAPKAPAGTPKRTVRPLPAGGMAAEPPASPFLRRMAYARSTSAMLDLMREFGTPFEVLLKQ